MQIPEVSSNEIIKISYINIGVDSSGELFSSVIYIPDESTHISITVYNNF